MSINLQKGQKINLSKESRSGLNKVMVGLGWDEVPQKRGLFAPKPQDIDCDAFAILLGYDGKLLNHTNDIKQCTVFFNNLVWPGGSIRHMGDNLTGAGEGDDEQILLICRMSLWKLVRLCLLLIFTMHSSVISTSE